LSVLGSNYKHFFEIILKKKLKLFEKFYFFFISQLFFKTFFETIQISSRGDLKTRNVHRKKINLFPSQTNVWVCTAPLQFIFISRWSKRRLTNSGQAVPAGRAGGPAQPVTLLTGQTGLFDQCASQAGLHKR
jgi:hypothetical protein